MMNIKRHLNWERHTGRKDYQNGKESNEGTTKLYCGDKQDALETVHVHSFLNNPFSITHT